MKENERIVKLFEKGYDGDPWLDVNLTGVLKNCTAAQASSKISSQWNSIWEILNHIVAWRLNILKRMQGEIVPTPAHNYFMPVENSSEEAWAAALKALDNSQQQWVTFLKTFNESQFEMLYPKNDLNYYEHIHGILHHDNYHLGQIVMLAKHVK